MRSDSRFRKGICIEWEIVRIYVGQAFEVWESVASEREGHKRLRALRAHYTDSAIGPEFALMRVTQERIPSPARRKSPPSRSTPP